MLSRLLFDIYIEYGFGYFYSGYQRDSVSSITRYMSLTNFSINPIPYTKNRLQLQNIIFKCLLHKFHKH